MSVFLEVLKELGSMFFGAPRLATPLLVLIAIAASVAHIGAPQIAGAMLVLGCLALLAENVWHTARKAKRPNG